MDRASERAQLHMAERREELREEAGHSGLESQRRNLGKVKW